MDFENTQGLIDKGVKNVQINGKYVDYVCLF